MKAMQSNIIIEAKTVRRIEDQTVEMCEHKGIGHPDTLADGICEAASRALSQTYLREFGHVLHHNLDKGLVVAGQSRPRFGGGKIQKPIKVIICGRATSPEKKLDVTQIAVEAVRQYLKRYIRCDLDYFKIQSEISEGSGNLKEVFKRNRAPKANDTSFGCGYAPLSSLEKNVLHLSGHLKSQEFRRRFPAAGDDFKIMGYRLGREMTFIVALAFVDRYVKDTSEYFETKNAIRDDLAKKISGAVIHLNRLDDVQASDESGLYLTVTGLSAEMGDDGQVGRGNRVNGLITPCREMSLEAAAGKNPTHHVGKIYNVLAHRMAGELVEEIEEVKAASIKLLSAIGQPVSQPQIVSVEVRSDKRMTMALKEDIRQRLSQSLKNVSEMSRLILEEKVSLY